MNVANLYDRLNERERVSALVLALVRGDDLETQRLNATAPRRTEQRRHHFDRVKAVWSVAATVRIEMLATLADLWHSQSRLAWATDNAEANGEGSADINRDAQLWRAFVDVCCWKLSQQQAAWRIVAERLGIAPEFLDTFGDCIALKLTEARMHDNTPTADAVRERLSEFSELGETIKLATSDSIAAGWWGMIVALSD